MKTIVTGSLVLLGLVACSSAGDLRPQESIGQQEQELAGGALVDVSMDSTVGVLLDEIPEGMRARVAAELIAKPRSFWKDRAQRQLALMTYRLIFRTFFYTPKKNRNPKMALPLPPEELRDITLRGTPVRVRTAKHDTVQIDYRFEGTLLTDTASPGISEPRLGSVGGTWSEPAMLPVDPEMVFQRTRYACMDEADFPPNSVDSEEVDSFYDQDCKNELTLSPFDQCHATEVPGRSCERAVTDEIGKVETAVEFKRVAWNRAKADRVRFHAPTNNSGADLTVVQKEFRVNRVTYRYIQPNACELSEERCVTGSGWRKLLQFATSDENVGNHPLDIGAVDYYLTGEQSLNDRYHIFEYSSCHSHYHFSHYGSFSLGNDEATTAKRGFCLQSTDRLGNSEQSPLHNPYGGCDYQGVEVGWIDQYKAGLPCQWIDVTDVDTRSGPVTKPLKFHSNPDGFLCEGTPVLDSAGNPTFEPTAFRTAAGEVVYRSRCTYSPAWSANNEDSYNVTLPETGQGLVTQACARGQIGPLRNCGFTRSQNRVACTAGTTVRMHCALETPGAPQVLRVCDYSSALGSGIPCKYEESIKSKVVTAAGADVNFGCPTGRGVGEPGGAVSFYTGPVLPGDAPVKINCAPR